MNDYPKGFVVSLLVTLLALFTTGILLVPNLLATRLDWEMTWRLESGGRLVVTALHVLLAFATLALVGALWSLHMRRGWRLKRARGSGASFVILWGLLVLTSLGILYLGNETASLAASLAHTILGGLVVPLMLLAHFISGRLSRRQNGVSERTAEVRETV